MSDATPVFVQVLDSPLFQMQSGVADNIGWSGYLLDRGITPPIDPITIADSFSNFAGSYLFAGTAPPLATTDEVNTFIDAVRRQLDVCYGPGIDQIFTGRACLWITDPSVPAFGACSRYGFTFSSSIFGTRTDSDLNNIMGRQLTFAVNRDTSMSATATGLALRGVSGTPISFVTSPTPGMAPTVSPNEAAIPLFGPYCGCFLLTGRLSPRITLAYLNAGVHYGHGTPDRGTVIQNYPVVDTTRDEAFTYIGAVDPLDPVNANTATVNVNAGQLRTLFAPVTSNGSGQALASWLRTDSNRAIAMIPRGSGTADTGPAPNDGAFVLEYADPTGTDPSRLYFTLAGDFALQVAGAAGTSFDLLTGLFGTESMSFRPFIADSTNDRLRFTPRQAAFAPVFPLGEVSLQNPESGALRPRLDTSLRTSWAMMINRGTDTAVRYLAQPDGSSLFAASGADNDGTVVLDAYSTGAVLRERPGFTVPLAVYAGLAAGATPALPPAELAPFESQIIAPMRKGIVAAEVNNDMNAMKAGRAAVLRAGAFADAPRMTTTPQGLLASVVDGTLGADYVGVTLAQSVSSLGTSQMMFENLTTQLQTLFQTNQLVAVAVNPRFLGAFVPDDAGAQVPNGDPTFRNRVTIADWEMAAAVGEGVMATDYRNVMIFKFGDGTVQERVGNPNKWVQADDFSVIADGGDPRLSLTGLSSWLQDFIAAAIVEATVKKNTLYMNFASIVTDPNWNGVLVLRANVTRFPDQIKGLMAGIDLTQFEAHHFGVTVSRVQVNGTDITIDGPSSMFGLIDYQYPLYRQNVLAGGNPDLPIVIGAQGAYGFTVLQLQALFKNTALVDFRSRVQLTLNELFASKVTNTMTTAGQSIANGVVLKGSYQTQGTTSTYVFEQSGTTVFAVDCSAFNAIALTRVQFNTLTADSGGATPSVISRFLIWGALNFAVLPDRTAGPFDVLSFGTAATVPIQERGAGLSFSNLQITMTSPVDTPNAVVFAFNAGEIAFNISASEARPGSLFPTFALQLEGFIASNGEKRPPEMGYLAVGVNTPITAISGPWFGVVYKVTMGTPGALVSGAGFESRMLLAWSPQSKTGATSASVFVGLQLPGAAPGAKLLSIQGILKVSVASIQLTYDLVAGTTDTKAFNLRLSNIGLKFLGIVKLPPTATINFFLFGDPGGTGSLGWYAAFVQDRTTTAMPHFGETIPAMLAETAGTANTQEVN